MTTQSNGSDVPRPYRLMIGKDNIPRACYAHPTTCLEGALKRAHWDLQVGQTIECVNTETTRVLGWYRRHATGQITFWRNRNG